ncbi:hypothetical protein NTGM5_840002 [Candidatus Nitrotoga sp. M5]|nr:hypothetical protein NTGM5_840002 [Candidatus Nitrotoga sp. M5]
MCGSDFYTTHLSSLSFVVTEKLVLTGVWWSWILEFMQLKFLSFILPLYAHWLTKV